MLRWNVKISLQSWAGRMNPSGIERQAQLIWLPLVTKPPIKDSDQVIKVGQQFSVLSTTVT